MKIKEVYYNHASTLITQSIISRELSAKFYKTEEAINKIISDKDIPYYRLKRFIWYQHNLAYNPNITWVVVMTNGAIYAGGDVPQDYSVDYSVGLP